MANLADINSYRLTSLEDPPEEVLAQIMKEAAEEARIENEKATKRFFDDEDANKLVSELLETFSAEDIISKEDDEMSVANDCVSTKEELEKAASLNGTSRIGLEVLSSEQANKNAITANR